MAKRNKLKKFLIFLGVLVVMIALGLVVYVFSTEAPVSKGKLIYNKDYKPELSLDLYLPTKSIGEKSPVLVFFHGGAWIAGTKESINGNRFHKTIKALRDTGYTVISPQYTLAKQDQSPFPACIEDAFDVIEWIKTNAEELNLDTSKLGLMGESAGAHIALMLAYAKKDTFPQLALSVDYIVDVYGPTDLLLLSQLPALDTVSKLLSSIPDDLSQSLSITNYLLNFDPQEDSLRFLEFTKLYSPLHHVARNSPPTLIVQGDKDHIVPLSQSEVLATALDSLNVEYQIDIIEGMDHAFFGASWQKKKDIQSLITDFILKHSN